MQVPVLLILLALMTGAGGTPAPATPRFLSPESSQSLDVPPFRFYQPAQSDKDGNLFFHVDAGSFRKAVILKLAVPSGDPTLYTLSDEDDQNIVFGNFSVTPFGQVVILGQGRDSRIYAIRFSSKGTATTKTVLDFPEHMSFGSFVAFESGSMLVSGFYLPDAPEELRGKSFMAIFDESGKMRKQFDRELDKVDLSTVFRRLREGNATVGPDGNLYFLASDKVIVMSESGEIVRRLTYEKPAGGTASKIAVSHNLLAIWLLKEVKDRVTSEYLVLDLFTGRPFGFYAPAEEISNAGMAVSFSNQQGFTFLDSRDGHVKLISAPLR